MAPTLASPKPVEVLLIEDSAGDILFIRQILARESFPISIRVAVDATQAVEVLSHGQFKPDVVILDLNLPKLSGLEFLETYRHDVPVVVFSSSTNPNDIRRSYELGVRDFIPKPLDLDQYTQAVSYIVRRWGAGEVEAAV